MPLISDKSSLQSAAGGHEIWPLEHQSLSAGNEACYRKLRVVLQEHLKLGAVLKGVFFSFYWKLYSRCGKCEERVYGSCCCQEYFSARLEITIEWGKKAREQFHPAANSEEVLESWSSSEGPPRVIPCLPIIFAHLRCCFRRGKSPWQRGKWKPTLQN